MRFEGQNYGLVGVGTAGDADIDRSQTVRYERYSFRKILWVPLSRLPLFSQMPSHLPGAFSSSAGLGGFWIARNKEEIEKLAFAKCAIEISDDKQENENGH
jgi:hypothetical protein